jgi:hypothetical protein
VSVAGHGPRGGEGVDNFPTPAWCVHRLLEAWMPRAGFILEPAAGDGAIVKAATSRIERNRWMLNEVRREPIEDLCRLGCASVQCSDYLDEDPLGEDERNVTTVWTNPPFALAEQFIRRSAALFPDADLCFLVRLGFLASEGRAALWRELGAPDVYVLPNRPSFNADGKTDSSDYAWIVLPGDDCRDTGTLRILGTTGKDERKLRIVDERGEALL